MNTNLPLIKVVGVSASGKSTLVKALRQAGYNARPVSQEHSNVPTLWQEFDRPRVLIYLDVDLAAQQQRRPDVSWSKANRDEEVARLAHAHAHADLHLNTSAMSATQIAQIALAFLAARQTPRAAEPLPELAATGSAQAPPAPPVETKPERKRRRRKRA